MINRIWQICAREIRAYFLSPIAYIVIGASLVLNSFIFSILVRVFNQPQPPAGSIMQIFLGRNVFFWIILLLLTPTVTMRLFAEERRSGTLEVLMTAPVTDTEAVLGKYLGALFFYMAIWAPTLLYVLILKRFSPLDMGPIGSGYLYLLLVGSMFLAMGILISILTRSQIIAAIVSFGLMFLLFLAPVFLEGWIVGPGSLQTFMRAAFSYMNTWNHAGDFGKGIVDSRPLIYYTTSTGLFLFLSVWTLAVKKGK